MNSGPNKRVIHGLCGAGVGALGGLSFYITGWHLASPLACIGGGALIVGLASALLLDRFWDTDRWWWA